VSFIAITAGGGYAVEWGGPQAALWLMIGASALVAATAGLLPKADTAENGNGAPGFVPMRLADIKLFLHSPAFLLFLAAAGLAGASHAIYNTLSSVHWQSLGISPSAIGFLWAAAVLAEVVLFGFSRRVLMRAAPATLMAIAAAAAVVRWTVMAFDPPLVVLFPLQMLHALTFGAAHLGAIHFLAAAVPERYAATGQGLYATVASGIGMGGAYLIAGPLLHALGGPAFLFMAGFGALSLVFALLLGQRWGGESLGHAGGTEERREPAG
jgi:PPP family 3-phenylpropionic acid transporter